MHLLNVLSPLCNRGTAVAVAVSAAVVIVSTVLLPKIAVDGAAVDTSYDDYDPFYEVSLLYEVQCSLVLAMKDRIEFPTTICHGNATNQDDNGLGGSHHGSCRTHPTYPPTN